MNKEIELRFNDMKPVGETNADGLLRVSGYVNMTDQWSQMLGNETRFKERIKKGAWNTAIQRAIDKGISIAFLLEHEAKQILASVDAGSLTLREDEKGLYMEANIAPTSWGKDAHTLIDKKLLRGMSFGMQVLKDRWKKLSDGTYERTISDLNLFEVSAVRNPAYVQSKIQARSIEVIEDPQITQGDLTLMNLKEAKQKKQDLIKQVKPILDIQEQRSLEPDEQLKKQILSDEIRELSEHIEGLEAKNKFVKNRGNDKMTNQTELRAVEQFIRNQEGEELRALQAGTGVGALTVPTSLHDEVVEKLFEVAPLFAMSKNFTPVNGNLEILREQSLGSSLSAGFVDEMVEIPQGDFTANKVKLDQKRVGSAIELSQHLINDSGIDVVKHATNVLTRRVGNIINTVVLNGDVSKGQFEGLLNSVAIEDIVAGAATAITIDELLDVYNSLNPSYIGGAVWVVNRKTFNTIAKMKDSDGHYFLVRDVAETGVTYKLFGQPVYINNAMLEPVAGNRSVLFGNFSEGYATMTKKGLTFKKIDQDKEQALKGSVMLMLDGYMDGKIYNEDAFKFLKQKPSA